MEEWFESISILFLFKEVHMVTARVFLVIPDRSGVRHSGPEERKRFLSSSAKKYLKYECEVKTLIRSVNSNALYLLSEDMKRLAESDVVVFSHDFNLDNRCVTIYETANRFNIRTVVIGINGDVTEDSFLNNNRLYLQPGFREEWSRAVKKLKNSGADLSRICIAHV